MMRQRGIGAGPDMPAEVTADRAEVFISYSRQPPGQRPGSGAGQEAADRWRARKVATDLVAYLEGAIEGVGYQAWRDEPNLTVGDLFAAEIDAALLSCVGAVVLLDPEALDRSSWVWWESGILTWRQRVDPPVRVVPVLIGVEAQELSGHGYGPSRIDQTLAYIIDPAVADGDPAAYAAELKEHARQIAQALGELDGEPTGTVAGWLNRIAGGLPADCDSWRPEVGPKLSRGDRLRLAARPDRVVAGELLAADRDRFERIMEALSGFSFKDPEGLLRNLKPVWVPPGTVSGIVEAKFQPPGQRVITVNAAAPRTGVDVVRRAFPLISARRRLQWPVTAVTVDDAVTAGEKAITKKWGSDPGHVAENLGGCFVMVGGDGCPADDLARIVAGLASAHPALVYVVMAGARPVPPYPWLDPALPAQADEQARDFGAALNDFILPDADEDEDG